ncbi:PREDICTED: F-box protein CPR30-like [Fragaria vesca subsp. vesca]|uniref:F-box protein CPR30-like n=1 Tax=Fragaria vesca subsp. vesca TaxID=101020 RepID=UPI0002C31F92|nr:PREDICTED: F-box protein CPR30-like [Fragaria vesca subsp. vesca]
MERAQRMKSGNNNAELRVVMDLLELPFDILLNILSRLPAESLFLIRSVSKALLNMADDPSFARALSHNVHLQVPQLMLFDDHGGYYRCPAGTIQLLASLRSMKYDGCRDLTEGRHGINRQPYDGGGSPCFLVNPLRGGEVLRLPTLNKYSNVRKDWYGMGFDSLTNAHKIVRVSRVTNDTESRLVTQVLVLGESSWREIPSVPPDDLNSNINAKNACANGDMHWLIWLIREKKGISEETYHIISFDFKREEFYWTPHPLLESSNVRVEWTKLQLLTLRGSLALVCAPSSEAGTADIEIWVLKDYDKKEWTRDYIINSKHFSIHGSCHEWEHGIFFDTNMDTVFVDLNCFSVNRIKYRATILSYTWSLVSLKEYGNLVKDLAEEPSEYGGLESYNKLTYTFDRHILRNSTIHQKYNNRDSSEWQLDKRVDDFAPKVVQLQHAETAGIVDCIISKTRTCSWSSITQLGLGV